jgi:hypothetical protein
MVKREEREMGEGGVIVERKVEGGGINVEWMRKGRRIKGDR